MMKYLLKFVFACLTAQCFGQSSSYEMMLITDPYNDVIHRWDPENQVYLGSFGRGQVSNPNAVVVDKANNTAYVADGAVISKFNYFTGRYLGSINVTGIPTIRGITLAPDGNLVVNDPTTALKVSAATGATMVNLTRYSNNVISQVIQRPNGNFWMVTTNPVLNGSYVTYHNSSGSPIGFTQLGTTGTNDGTIGYGGIAFQGNVVAITVSYASNSSLANQAYTGTFTEGGVSVTSRSYPFQAANRFYSNPVFGHSTNAYFLNQSIVSNNVPKAFQFVMNPSYSGILYTPITEPLNTTLIDGGYQSISIVTAPEPPVWLPIGIGFALILVKRRS